jgi:hypothetical protein
MLGHYAVYQGTIAASIVYSKAGSDQPIGYAVTYAGGMISWKSKKQPVVAHSSSELELVALDSAAREAMWITSLFDQLKKPIQLPLQLWEDNQGTINITRNPVNHPGTKHIAVRYFAVRDWIQEGRLKVEYMKTSEMLADALTKPLNGARLREMCLGMGMTF